MVAQALCQRRLLSFSSDSGESDHSSHNKRLRRRGGGKGSASPGPSKHSTVRRNAPPAKKKKTLDATEDPTRKYCLGKLEEVFRDIFLRYPHVSAGSDEAPTDDSTLTDEVKDRALSGANQFAIELEQSVYELYSEPDKHGIPFAGAKYKSASRQLALPYN